VQTRRLCWLFDGAWELLPAHRPHGNPGNPGNPGKPYGKLNPKRATLPVAVNLIVADLLLKYVCRSDFSFSDCAP
jgi:hypothetical protein